MSHEIETTSGRFLKLMNAALWEVDYLGNTDLIHMGSALCCTLLLEKHSPTLWWKPVTTGINNAWHNRKKETTSYMQQCLNPIGGGELSKLQGNILREFRCQFFPMCRCCLFKLYKKGSFHLGPVTNLLSSHWDPAICLPCSLKWATVCGQSLCTVWWI